MTMWKGQHLTDLFQCLETVQTFDVPLRLMTPSLSVMGTHTCRMTAAICDTAAGRLQKCQRLFFPPSNEHFITSRWPVHFQMGLVFLQERPLWKNGLAWGNPHCYGATQNTLQARFPGRPSISILLSNHYPVHILHTHRCPWEASLLMCMYNTDALCTCSTPSTFIHDWLSRHAK